MKQNQVYSIGTGILCILWILAIVFSPNQFVFQFSITQTIFYGLVTIETAQRKIPPMPFVITVTSKFVIATYGLILWGSKGEAFFKFGNWSAINILILVDYILTACLIFELVAIVVYIARHSFDYEAEFKPIKAEMLEGESVEKCTICSEQLNAESVQSVTCSHSFHDGCIKGWIDKQHYDCPSCQVEFRAGAGKKEQQDIPLESVASS